MAATVLIVDDHAPFRRRARQILAAEGYEVIAEAATGDEALRQLESLRPDVVLLDLQLPDASGFDIARRIGEAGGSAPAVVLTSTRDGDEFATLIGRSGARGFVAKAQLSGAAIRALVA